MAKIIRWSIRCDTEKKDKEWLLDKGGQPPSKCPTTSSHTVLAAVQVEELEVLTAADQKREADAKAALQAEKEAERLAKEKERADKEAAVLEKEAERLEKEQAQSEKQQALAELSDAKKKITQLERPTVKIPKWRKK